MLDRKETKELTGELLDDWLTETVGPGNCVTNIWLQHFECSQFEQFLSILLAKVDPDGLRKLEIRKLSESMGKIVMTSIISGTTHSLYQLLLEDTDTWWKDSQLFALLRTLLSQQT